MNSPPKLWGCKALAGNGFGWCNTNSFHVLSPLIEAVSHLCLGLKRGDVSHPWESARRPLFLLWWPYECYSMSISEIPKPLSSFGKRDSILFRIPSEWLCESVACVLEVVCKRISCRTKTKWCRENSLLIAMISYWGHESSYSGSDRRSLPSSVLALTVSNSKYLKQREQCQDSVILPSAVLLKQSCGFGISWL